MNTLHAAAARGDAVTVMEQLSSAGALVLLNTQDGIGATPLYCAAHTGHACVTEQLIEAACNVHLQAKDGTAPLHIAAYDGHAAVTEQLIEARWNVDIQRTNGSTPRQVENGATPFHVAASQGQAAVAQLLLAARCNIHLQTKNGENALQAAQFAGHTAIATLIRNAKHKGAARGKKDATLQASPEKTKKQQEDADRAMRELLEEDEKEKAAAAAGSQKKSNKKKAGGQGTASAGKTAPGVRGGMQIWVKSLTGFVYFFAFFMFLHLRRLSSFVYFFPNEHKK
jgi:ankyrin repeat protein